MNVSNMIINATLQQRISLGLCVALGAALTITCFYTLWQWRSDWVLAHQTLSPPPAIATTDETMSLIAAIPNNHLFGQSIASGDVPITNLQLRVTGIVKVNNDLG